MTVFAHEPPSITSTSLSFFSDDATIYVPDKYKDRYTYLWGSGHYKISGQSLFLAPASPSWTGHYGSDYAGKTIVITNGTDSPAFGVNVSITNANDFEQDFGEFPSELSADSYTTFTITPKSSLPEGTYNSKVTVKATVNGTEVTETINLSFTVKRALTSAEITLSGSNVTVTLDGKTLTEGQDYALNYSNNGETTTVIVTGTGVYTGVVTESFDADLLPGVGLGPGTGLVPGSDNIPVVLPGTNAVNVAPSEHGSVSVTPGNSSVGGLVTVTVAPDEGCSLAGLTVTDASGSEIAVSGSGGTYTFTMPDSAVTVTATFRAGAAACDHGASCPLRAFNDLDAYAWYHDGIHYCLTNGLMDGTGAAAFEPNANMTRAMVWAILARIDGETVTGANWAETARAWAISTGVSDGADPDANVTREQLATMLWRFAGSETATGSLTRYPDYAEISSWADQAMLWATVLGVIEGNESGNIAPTAAATRAQAATMLMRFCGSVE